jgi:hypothetical protein
MGDQGEDEMPDMVALPSDDPVMLAWNAYKQTEDYANTLKWAVLREHTEGSLWGAFLSGWIAGQRDRP